MANAYAGGLRRLLDMRRAGLVLTLAPAAYAQWKVFAQAVEVELRPGGDFDGMTDWSGKLPGAAARIAALFHCVKSDLPGERIISDETMAEALELAALLADHAREALGLMGADASRQAALKILSWLERTRPKTFKARDCFCALKGTYGCMDELRPGFDALTERGYIRVVSAPSEKGGKGGRPSQVFEVHSDLVEVPP